MKETEKHTLVCGQEILLVSPEWGLGHHDAFAREFKRLLETATVKVTVAVPDAVQSEKYVGHYSPLSDKRFDGSAFEAETEELVRARRRHRAHLSVFCYSGNPHRLEAFRNLASRWPGVRFGICLLHGAPFLRSPLPAGVSWPENLWIGSESAPFVRAWAELNPAAPSLLQVRSFDLVPKCIRSPNVADPAGGRPPASRVIFAVSNRLTRGAELLEACLGDPSKWLEMVGSLTLKYENPAAIPYAAPLRRACRGVGVPVSTIRGFVDDCALDDLLRQADLIVLPYGPEQFRWQASGLFVAALSRGVPTVVLKGTWMAEELSNLGLDELAIPSGKHGFGRHIAKFLKKSGALQEKILKKNQSILARYSEAEFADSIRHAFDIRITTTTAAKRFVPSSPSGNDRSLSR